MVKRNRLKESLGKKDLYEITEENIKGFIPSGCTLLDCVLGGGFARPRIINIIGDRSTGKTLLAIEASANFKRVCTNGEVIYYETEFAFDKDFAQSVGFPTDAIFPDGIDTVEKFYKDLCDRIEANNIPKFVIVDSLDALTTKQESERDMGTSTYGTEKAKAMSELFRRITGKLSNNDCTLIIISQTRDNIGVMFGKRYTRNGGKALDFYASQILYLAQKKQLKKTISKVDRVVGIHIIARCEKNKCAKPFRSCEFPIIFDYGIDDLSANISFLESIGKTNSIPLPNWSPLPKNTKTFMRDVSELSNTKWKKVCRMVSSYVKQTWNDIEDRFEPTRKKYED